MLTFTPVALVKASISFTKASSSDCTKYFQRSIESLASFSGFHGAVCAQAFAQSSRAGPVERAGCGERGAALHQGAASEQGHGRSSVCVMRLKRCPRRLVEQVHEPRIGFEPDLVARLELRGARGTPR